MRDDSLPLDGLVILDLTRVLAGPIRASSTVFPAMPHPVRPIRVTASPYHFDGESMHPRGAAPYHVGEHIRQVLGELAGYDEARIAALLEAGVIGRL